MKQFNEEEARKMSESQISQIVCEGMAEVTEGFAELEKAKCKLQGSDVDGIYQVTERCPCCGKKRKVYRKVSNQYNKLITQAQLFRKFAMINFAFNKQEELNNENRTRNKGVCKRYRK